jgi:hypothetical protein
MSIEEKRQKQNEANNRYVLRKKVLSKLIAKGLGKENALKKALELVPYRMEHSALSKEADRLLEGVSV